jgi:hypothetical protein
MRVKEFVVSGQLMVIQSTLTITTMNGGFRYTAIENYLNSCYLNLHRLD